MDVRYGFSRYESGHNPPLYGFDVGQLGFAPDVVRTLTSADRMFPQITMGPYQTLGSEAVNFVPNDVHSLFLSFTKQAGSHSVKIGAEARVYRETYWVPTRSGGMGQSLASLLLGIPQSGEIDVNAPRTTQSTYFAFYVHDTWRATAKLTLDLGLRWEYEGPRTERFNRAVRGFDPAAALPAAAAAEAAYAVRPDAALPASQFHVRGGLVYAGVNGQPRGLWDRSFAGIAPRLGFAYRALGKTVLRGGIGIFPIALGESARNRPIQTGFTQITTLVPTLDNGLHFTRQLGNPFPDGVTPPSGSSLGAATYLGNSISFFNPAGKIPYTVLWSLNVQRALPGKFLLEVGYRGNKSLKLRVSHNLNGLPVQYLSTLPARDAVTINYLSQNVPNPFTGLLPGTNMNGSTMARSQLLLPYPQFTGVSSVEPQGYSWYHALQARLESRLSAGFTVQVSYSWSKWMQAMEYLNAGDPMPWRGISPDDVPHHLAISGLYELPVGKGKALWTTAGPVANRVFGGWQVGAIYHSYSGLPLSWGNIFFNGDVRDIPLSGSERSIYGWFNTGAGFVTSSSRQPGSNLRTFPLRLSGVRAGYFNMVNLSLNKNVQLYEGLRFQFRAEARNALNHPTEFAGPNMPVTSSAFGSVTGINSSPRSLQLGLKVIF